MLINLNQLFQNFSTSVDTKQKKLLLSFTTLDLVERLRAFLDPDANVAELLDRYSMDPNGASSIYEKRDVLRKEKSLVNYIHPYAYRLYDTRYIFAHPVFFTEDINRSFQQQGITLMVGSGKEANSHLFVFASKDIPDSKFFSQEQQIDFQYFRFQAGSTNFNPTLLATIQEHFSVDMPLKEIDLFHYIYLILFSSMYHSKESSSITGCFPVVEDFSSFIHLADVGRRLLASHTMEEQLPLQSGFLIKGDNLVTKVEYTNAGYTPLIKINDTQCFTNISSDVWNFSIGEKQVLSEWLRARLDRKLSYMDIVYCQKIIASIEETISIMKFAGKELISSVA
jgi:hypothetical protein